MYNSFIKPVIIDFNRYIPLSACKSIEIFPWYVLTYSFSESNPIKKPYPLLCN